MRFHLRTRPELDDTTPRARDGRERGATLVEYALLVALLAVPTIGAINYVQDGAETKVQTTATGISTHTIPVVTTTTAAGGATTTSTTTTSTTTTVKPTTTTAAPTTTTTVKPTTTTSTTTTSTTTTVKPTTTTVKATAATPAWSTPTTSKSGSGSNRVWTSRAPMTVTDNLGQPVANASVKVKVEYQKSDGSWATDSTQTISTDSNGQIDVSPNGKYGQKAGLANTYSKGFRFTVVSVTKSGLTIGSGQQTSVANPYD